MDSIREQKLEALKNAADYLERLIPAMESVIAEIRGDMKEDTVDFLLQIIDGFNFIVETYNVTGDLINSPEVLINDDELEKTVGKLSSGFSRKDYPAIAEELSEAVIPFLKVIKAAAARYE
ncbi:MAG: hypothetical protein K6G58_10580 [Lachnospiraceae bacterium]|nr:hypothetical protein [Lachnospiraceae bacterium]